MIVKDVMTSAVITAAPETKVADIVRMLVEHGISAVPVVDAEMRVLGIVSEGDLLRRPEIGTDKPHRRWAELLTTLPTQAESYVKTHGLLARDVMTSPAITIPPDATLRDAADIMERHRVKRLPVTSGGRLEGIVTRANLVRALAAVAEPSAATTPEDQAIRDSLLAALNQEVWARRADSNVVVKDGIVHLWGTVGSDQERRAFEIAAERTPGVRGIENHLAVEKLYHPSV